MYQGDERRNNDDLKLLEDKFNEFKLEVNGFLAGLKEWMLTTTEYRKELCRKIDDINVKISALPCKERVYLYQSIQKQIKWLWTITGGLLLAIIKEWVEKR